MCCIRMGRKKKKLTLNFSLQPALFATQKLLLSNFSEVARLLLFKLKEHMPLQSKKETKYTECDAPCHPHSKPLATLYSCGEMKSCFRPDS